MTYTDKNIPVECGECGEEIEGVKAMEDHILMFHMSIYDPLEAATYARYWADDSYEKIEEWEQEQTGQHRRDKRLPPIPRGIA